MLRVLAASCALNAILVIFIVSISGVSRAADPIASFTFATNNCVAPCAIFFDARGSTDADLTDRQDFTDLTYTWDFGDPRSGSWTHGAQAATPVAHPRNTDSGPVAGHLFEGPGVYTVTLTVFDGQATRTTYAASGSRRFGPDARQSAFVLGFQ